MTQLNNTINILEIDKMHIKTHRNDLLAVRFYYEKYLKSMTQKEVISCWSHKFYAKNRF